MFSRGLEDSTKKDSSKDALEKLKTLYVNGELSDEAYIQKKKVSSTHCGSYTFIALNQTPYLTAAFGLSFFCDSIMSAFLAQ